MSNFEHMTAEQLAEEDRRIARKLAALPKDADWGAAGQPSEQYDRFMAHDDDDAQAHAANEAVGKERRALEEEQLAVRELLRQKLELQHRKILDAAGLTPAESTHENQESDSPYEDDRPDNSINLPGEDY